MGLKEELLKLFKRELKTKEIDAPELGRKLRIRQLFGNERDYLDAFRLEHKGDKAKALNELYVVAFAAGVIDGDGGQVFKLEEVRELYAVNSWAIRRIADEVIDFSDFNEAALEKTKKNSNAALSEELGSNSRRQADSLPLSSASSGAAPSLPNSSQGGS